MGEAGTAENRGKGAEGQGTKWGSGWEFQEGAGLGQWGEAAPTRQKESLIHRHPQRLPSIL